MYYYVDFSGMLSKSKGQILRVAASFHILFQLPNGVHDVDDADHTLNGECDDNAIIADSAIIAAIAFVTLCCQQTAYIFIILPQATREKLAPNCFVVCKKV